MFVVAGRPVRAAVAVAAASLLIALLVAVPLAGKASAVAYPSSVSLAADKTTLATDESATLTASTDVAVETVGWQIVIWNTNTNSLVKVCMSGTTCSLTVGWHSDPQSYLAYVTWNYYSLPSSANATSNTVTIGPEPWSIALSTDKNVLGAGDSATLTATANQSVSSAGWQIAIWNSTSNSLVTVCRAGATCQTSVGWQSNPQAYVAYVTWNFSSLPSTAAATSNSVTIAAEDWSISLSTDTSILAPGGTATLTAIANQSVTSAGWQIAIWDTDTNSLAKVCQSGATCQMSLGWSGSLQTYKAYVTWNYYSLPSSAVVAESDPLTIEPLTGSSSVYYTIHSWNSDSDPGSTTFDVTAAGQGLSANGGPCASVSCNWVLTFTYTDSNGSQHVIQIASGSVAAGLNAFSADATGAIDLSDAQAGGYLTLSLTTDGGASPALAAGGIGAGTVSGDILDGIDVDAAFDQIVANAESGATTDACRNLLFVPGSHVQDTSTSDEYNDCEAATGGGQITLQMVKDLAAKYGPWIVLTLTAVADTTQAPPSPDPSHLTVTPDQNSVQRLAQALIGQSAGKMDNEANAEVAAEDCLRQLAWVAGALDDPVHASCESTPVFFPGGDNPAPTANDYNDLFTGQGVLDGQAHPSNILLTWIPPSQRSSTSWKNSLGPCPNSTTSQHCDEYPFLSTRQAATNASALALVPASQNTTEGGLLGAFYTRCGMSTRSNPNFLVVPMTQQAAPPTMYTCGS